MNDALIEIAAPTQAAAEQSHRRCVRCVHWLAPAGHAFVGWCLHPGRTRRCTAPYDSTCTAFAAIDGEGR